MSPFNAAMFVPVLLLLAVVVSSTHAIRVHHPTAVTSAPPLAGAQLSPDQIAYLLQNYADSAKATAGGAPAPTIVLPHIVLNPPHHDYTPIDAPHLRTMSATLRAATAAGVSSKLDDDFGQQQDSRYFVPRPTFASAAAAVVDPSAGYDLYFPQAEDARREQAEDAAFSRTRANEHEGALNLAYLRDMQPPAQPLDTDEPNYYALLKAANGNKRAPPKKFAATKKPSVANSAAKQSAAGKPSVARLVGRPTKLAAVASNDDEGVYVGQASSHSQVDVEASDEDRRRTPKAAMRTLRTDELNTGEYLPAVLRNGNAAGNRIAYQMHGFAGPQSYRFGYDTGKGANRQFRVEQRDKHGNVAGEYGYADGRGKMTVYKYTSNANDGFRTEKMQK